MQNIISKIAGVGLTVGLVFGLTAALFAAPVSADMTKWGLVNTPSWKDLVILPASDILDYDIGGDGDTIYAVLEVDYDCTNVGAPGMVVPGMPNCGFALVKSTDGGVTWSDITDNVTSAASLPAAGFRSLNLVSVATDDEDWVAVAGYPAAPAPAMVVASKDGGANFSYAGELHDTDEGTYMDYIYDLDVSIEVDGIHNIALAGMTNMATVVGGQGSVFRLKAGTWLTGAWEDTSKYPGWDDSLGKPPYTEGVVACEFSPNFDLDDTIVCMGVVADGSAHGLPYIQSGIWESGGGSWNSEAGFPNAFQIKSDGGTLWTGIYNRSMGLSLPADYDGSDPGARSFFIYVDAFDDDSTLVGGYVFRVDNASLSPRTGPSGDPLLASIDVHGDANTGKIMIGEYVKWDNEAPDVGAPIEAECCTGVRVWHTEELDFCCPQWDGACKNPSGPYMALVMYTPDGQKEYATTSGTMDDEFFDFPDTIGGVIPFNVDTGTPLDESAFSVSRDDAVSFNQLGLIDTDIDYLSDVAVCPDCGTIYLSTINLPATQSGSHPCIGDECGTDTAHGWCDCDSVWRSYDDGATWERILHGEWDDGDNNGWPLLRLPCDAVEDCCDQDPVSPSGTIYVGLNDMKTMFYSRDCGQCWSETPAIKVAGIQDFCVESENIVYVLDEYGKVSKSTQYGRRWSTPVDTKVGAGHTIACCCDEGLVVVAGAGDDKVAWSDDGGDSWNLTDALPGQSSQDVHVACDPVCKNTIYAALSSAPGMRGIYRTDITDGSWDDLNAGAFPYYGIVVAREGTLYAVSNAIGVDSTKDLCEEGRFTTSGDKWYSGVARNLTPCETACCGKEDWDYLICGLGDPPIGPDENFNSEPSALKICGCLSADTNSVLWAIDTQPYDVIDGAGNNDLCGGLWSYEDCAAKHGPTLASPADGAVLPCEACAGCDSSPFTMQWERMCNACSWDIVIMDEDGNQITSWDDKEITGDPPKLYVTYGLECGNTYTWKVREANTACECIHSPWSEIWSFTVAVSASDAISLLSPDEGALAVQINNVGFSWSSVRDADSYSFVLSPNAALTGALVSQDMSSTAFNYSGPLDYSKSYYWQIKAWKDGTLLTTSAIGVFSTMAEPQEPTPPVVIEETPAPVLEIPPAEQITPTWIYAIIGIGAALAVVVIVLIVRTRRP
jgi:hypothetical protein